MRIFGRNKKKDGEEQEETGEFQIDPGISIEPLKKSYEVADEYFVRKPIARVKIVESPFLGEGLHYFVDEIPLSEGEKPTLRKIRGILSKEMGPPTSDDMTPEVYVLDQAERVAEGCDRI